MMMYNDLDSLVKELGISKKALYYASNSVDKHYYKTRIPKKSGGFRELHVPDEFLKSIQRKIVDKILNKEKISSYATAYKNGGSTIANAKPHLKNQMILKLDIRHFFDKITYPMVKEKVFREEQYSESIRILLAILCVYQHNIPQGAPTSPVISNIVMRDFDNIVGQWCKEHEIVYTRYCDDMTFSGVFEPKQIISFVNCELRKMGFFLNQDKTTVLHDGQRKMITGIVVNEKLTVPNPYKKKIRQELYYCMKYGIESHMERTKVQNSTSRYIQKLLGRINYALSVSEDEELLQYRNWLLDERRKYVNDVEVVTKSNCMIYDEYYHLQKERKAIDVQINKQKRKIRQACKNLKYICKQDFSFGRGMKIQFMKKFSEEEILSQKDNLCIASRWGIEFKLPKQQLCTKPYILVCVNGCEYQVDMGQSMEGNLRRIMNFLTKFEKVLQEEEKVLEKLVEKREKINKELCKSREEMMENAGF